MLSRGALGRWDFSHGQMRLAVRQLLADLEVPESVLHGVIANHLLAVSSDDPLRQTETMIHLLGSEDWTAAATYYGVPLDRGGRAGRDARAVRHRAQFPGRPDHGDEPASAACSMRRTSMSRSVC